MSPPTQVEISSSKRASRDNTYMFDDFDFELEYGEGVLAEFSRALSLEELTPFRVGSSFMADPSVHSKAMANDSQNYMWEDEDEDLLLRSQAMPHPARNQVSHKNSRTHSISIKSIDESHHTAMDTDDMNQPRRPSDEYSQALMNLAYSMQRTEESRKKVMLQRSLLTSDQQHALKIAKEQFRAQTELVAQKSQQEQSSNNTYSRQVTSENTSSMGMTNPPISTSSIIDAFFSGSRGSLTTGLDQSRMQLNNYMGNVHQRTGLSSFLG